VFRVFDAAAVGLLSFLRLTDHKQKTATLFVHQFQRFEDVPILTA
jgi:hypothetical protein